MIKSSVNISQLQITYVYCFICLNQIVSGGSVPLQKIQSSCIKKFVNEHYSICSQFVMKIGEHNTFKLSHEQTLKFDFFILHSRYRKTNLLDIDHLLIDIYRHLKKKLISNF